MTEKQNAAMNQAIDLLINNDTDVSTLFKEGNPPQKQSTKGVEFSRNKKGDSINDNIKTH